MIEIKKKYKIFSEKMPTKAVIPKTKIEVAIFPTRLLFRDIFKDKKIFEISLNLKGPFKEFIVFQDLEKHFLEITGICKNGYFCYRIFEKNKEIIFFLKRSFGEIATSGHKNFLFSVKTKTVLFKVCKVFSFTLEKLFLGMHKKMNVEDIDKRKDLKEIFPIWFSLGQINFFANVFDGTAKLFLNCIDLIVHRQKELLEESFLNIYKACFKHMFVPTLFDEKYQAIVDITPFDSANTFTILRKGYECIRSLFFQENKNELKLLPCLPNSMHTGKLLNIKTYFGEIDIKWSKKILKEVVLRSQKKAEINFFLQSKIKSFRMRTNKREKGKVYKAKNTFSISPEGVYYFDRFLK